MRHRGGGILYHPASIQGSKQQSKQALGLEVYICLAKGYRNPLQEKGIVGWFGTNLCDQKSDSLLASGRGTKLEETH